MSMVGARVQKQQTGWKSASLEHCQPDGEKTSEPGVRVGHGSYFHNFKKIKGECSPVKKKRFLLSLTFS